MMLSDVSIVSCGLHQQAEMQVLINPLLKEYASTGGKKLSRHCNRLLSSLAML